MSDSKFYVKKQGIPAFMQKIKPRWSNLVLWFFAILLFILFCGYINTLFNSEAHFFDPIIFLVALFNGGTLDGRWVDILKGLANGTINTFTVSMVSLAIGFFIALLFAVILVSVKPKFHLKRSDPNFQFKKQDGKFPIKQIFTFLLDVLVTIIQKITQMYVDFFRSTPLLVQILLISSAISNIFPGYRDFIDAIGIPHPMFSGTIALAMNTAAYQTEIIRSGILAIPKGQTEASRALGMTSLQTMRYVILPQAIRIIVPPLTNEMINMILNSSLLSSVGAREITNNAYRDASRFFLWEVYIVAAIFYFAIAFSLSNITKRLEKKYRIPGLGVHND